MKRPELSVHLHLMLKSKKLMHSEQPSCQTQMPPMSEHSMATFKGLKGQHSQLTVKQWSLPLITLKAELQKY